MKTLVTLLVASELMAGAWLALQLNPVVTKLLIALGAPY